MAEVTRVGVVGCGLMGSGIAEVAARAGLEVTVVEADSGALERGRARVEKSLGRAVASGKLDAGARDAALARLAFDEGLVSLAGCDVVIEAVAELEVVKREVFAALDEILEAPDAVLASNTSSIPIARLAAATARPERVVGLHFFNPVPVMGLVEVTPSLLTSPATLERAETFVSGVLAKSVVRSQDRAGFVVNALLVPYLLAAIRLLESGGASAADIDQAMRSGCAHPMGPLELSDFIGLDTVKSIADVLYAEYRDGAYVPPPLLSRMVEAGRLGRKSGRGFHDYGREAR
ncbi:MAG TPA: 3-hydroxybutyryl-CoA dehydrogenase [Acidimicrobiales bacterium]|nr:3-hydroxybutyryl-CoA dehydrogenase [Acidimicrobiales bacterium]